MEPTPPQIQDIAPPVDVFPYPMWMVAVLAISVALILALIGWLIWRWMKRRPVVPPPTPREVALSQLEALRPAVDTLDPQEFSDEVSKVLRIYLTRQFGLRATKQTSQEFLASLSGERLFDDERKELLAQFLEKCDLIKFARMQAGSVESAVLLDQAMAFVSGPRTEDAVEEASASS
jgi:hypothetical protein